MTISHAHLNDASHVQFIKCVLFYFIYNMYSNDYFMPNLNIQNLEKFGDNLLEKPDLL